MPPSTASSAASDPPWLPWLAQATRLLDSAGLSRAQWAWGGGTLLALRHRHRTSRDMEIFLDDVQLVGRLSPRLNDWPVRYVETAHVIRLEYGTHEIDFIVAMQVAARRRRG